MRHLISSVLVAALALAATPSFAQEVPAGPPALATSVSEVTVYSDRARITREAAIDLRKSSKTWAITKLPGWVDDGSVRVSLRPGDAGRIVDVRVQRTFLARSTDSAYREAEGKVQEIADQISALDDTARILQVEAEQVMAIKVFSMEKLPKDAALRDIKIESYGQVVSFITERLEANAKARRDIQRLRRELQPELDARQRALAELQGLTMLEETTVLVTASGSGRAILELTYMLPGATWEPVHELRAEGSDPRKAQIATYAVVTQTTGEDWKDVDISFSTQSSTASNKIPQITALTLGDGEAASRIMEERAQSFNRAKQAFEGQNRLWNKMNAPAFQLANQGENFDQVYDNNFEQMQLVQTKAAAVFQRLSSRGTSAHFPGDGKSTIRMDGNPVRVPIGLTTLDAQQQVVAVPEQSLNAVRTLQMINAGDKPLLPGRVSLFHDGAFLGMTDLDFVAAGETFAVFLGVADQVKLSRVLDRKNSDIDRKKTTRMRVKWVITVENLSDQPVTLDLADRIPISQNSAIEVDKISITGDMEPDSKGLLKWTLTLAPKEKRTFTIGYRVEYPPALVRQLNTDRARKRASMPSSPSMDFDDESEASEQIMKMEQLF
ncbi:MAG: mucoidy inhibitor MuiA family protein [Pseudomonadota bacterium]